jgi:hypothetical protein
MFLVVESWNEGVPRAGGLPVWDLPVVGARAVRIGSGLGGPSDE